MRMFALTAALALVAVPALATAQSTTARAETVYVKGSVTGIVPTGTNFVITGSRSVFLTLPDTTAMSASASMSDMNMNTSDTTSARSLGRKVSHGVGEAGGDVSKAGKKLRHGAGEAAGDASKLGKKAAHGVKEAASDVKKEVTGKP